MREKLQELVGVPIGLGGMTELGNVAGLGYILAIGECYLSLYLLAKFLVKIMHHPQ